jgi:hypothetical protein
MRLDEMFETYAIMHESGIEDEYNQPEEIAWLDRKAWDISPNVHL